jgi:arabinogalactan oligomer/maltooligosaccharide transport system permease protein
MIQAETRARGVSPLARFTDILARYSLRLIALMLVDAFALMLLYLLIRDGVWPLALMLIVVTILVNVINLYERAYPLRWMTPALAIIALMVLYPIFFTVYTAFTNYSDGHLLTQIQCIRRLGQDQFLPEGGMTYSWTAFRSTETGDLLMWFVGEEGDTYLGTAGQPLQPATAGEAGIGALDADGVPVSIEGYQRLGMFDVLPILDTELAGLEFGELPRVIRISSIREAAQLQQRYVYDEAMDAIVDGQTGIIYYANDRTGFFASESGETLSPGYQVVIGFHNFARLFTSAAMRGPFIRVFGWTITFAFFSVLTTFSVGLLMALVFDHPNMPLRKLFRSLLILPYAIPGIIGILIWRGMLNENLGVISTTLADFFGRTPGWFTNPTWAKIGILLINLWLGYPYMMLVCSGALQAIPKDIYEAAQVDGASAWQQFTGITLPLILVGVGPLS